MPAMRDKRVNGTNNKEIPSFMRCHHYHLMPSNHQVRHRVEGVCWDRFKSGGYPYLCRLVDVDAVVGLEMDVVLQSKGASRAINSYQHKTFCLRRKHSSIVSS